MQSFEKHYGAMHGIIKHMILTVANSLYSDEVISSEVLDTATDWSKSMDERCSLLLSYVESGIKREPSKFSMLIEVLDSDCYSQPLANKLLHSYSESNQDRL